MCTRAMARTMDEFWTGVLCMDLTVPGSRSLKDRRQAVRSLKERLHNKFSVHCAEVGDLDSWVRACLSVAVCANAKAHVVDVLANVVQYARRDHGVVVGQVRRRYLDLHEMLVEEPPDYGFVDEWDDEDSQAESEPNRMDE
jgi:uncharacterized protein YlxP (DUF503 family)